MGIEINPQQRDAESEAADFAVIAAATDQIAHSAKSAEMVFRANARRAAEEIVSLALGAANERVRLDASKYVVERVMGKVPDTKDIDNKDGGAPWDSVYGTVVREPSAEERANNIRAITSKPAAAPQSRN